jgi:hypothetical protein
LTEHRAEQAGADLLPAILQRRKPIAVVEPSMAAFPMAAIERNDNSTFPTDLLDFASKFIAGHDLISHISVRISREKGVS